MSEKKSYAAPRIVRHGDAVQETRGTCTCRTEPSCFKPALDDL